MNHTNAKAWVSLALLAAVEGLLLFLCAGTADYWQAWVYLAIFFGSSAGLTLYLMARDPALLRRRMSGGPAAEKRTAQKIIMLCISIAFIALLAVPALDRRFGWSAVPLSVAIAGDLLMVAGMAIILRVYRENTFGSATIEIAPGQKVISTGPYAIVRHPMYAGGLLYLAGTPLSLGSYWGLLAVAAMLPFLIWRLFDEERLLSKDLPGYTAYCAKVRWRLLPGVF